MCGVASRRKAEDLIRAGLVKVNGEKIKDYVEVEDGDVVEVNEKVVKPQNYVYYMFNKPAGYVTTKKDPQGRKTVFDLVHVESSVFSVGRLDRDTEGLLLFTNDGELSQILLHPRYEVRRVYEALVEGVISKKELEMLKSGVDLPYGYTAKMETKVLSEKNGLARVSILIREGRKREIRRTFKYLGHPVVSLKRISFGPINLDERIRPGEYRELTREEVKVLKDFVDRRKKMRPAKRSHP